METNVSIFYVQIFMITRGTLYIYDVICYGTYHVSYHMKIVSKQDAYVNEFSRSILSAVPFGISVVDEQGNMLFFNEYFAERKEYLISLNKKLVDVGETITTEMVNTVDDQNYKITRTGMLFNEKKVYLEIFKNITERKQAEKKLQASEEKFAADRKRIADELQRSETKFRAIFQYSPAGIARFDSQGVVTDCNESYTRIIGASREKNIGFHLLSSTKNKLFQEAVRQALSGHIGIFEGPYITTFGHKKLVLRVECGPIIHSSGVVDGGIQIVEDNTEREATKQKMKKYTNKLEDLTVELKKFELALESAFDAIAITNKSGSIVYANKVAAEMAGCSQHDMIGQGLSVWGQLVDKIDYTLNIPFKKVWESIKKTRRNFSGELMHQDNKGSVFITELHVTPVCNKEKKIVFFVATARDITKIKEVDRAKTEFVSLASHQLRTPLAGISLASELLLRHAAQQTGKQRKEYLEEIFSSTKKMSTLINDLLNVSRIEMGTFNISPEACDIVQSTETILDNLKSQFNEKKQLVTRTFAHNVPIVYFDKNAFNLIVDNLLTNAIRYTPKHGRIHVSIYSKKKVIIIEVSDTGYGIPAEESDKIFFKEFRAANARAAVPEGDGLGLYIVKLVADKVGVKVWFTANHNAPGTTFFVSIPIKS